MVKFFRPASRIDFRSRSVVVLRGRRLAQAAGSPKAVWRVRARKGRILRETFTRARSSRVRRWSRGRRGGAPAGRCRRACGNGHETRVPIRARPGWQYVPSNAPSFRAGVGRGAPWSSHCNGVVPACAENRRLSSSTRTGGLGWSDMPALRACEKTRVSTQRTQRKPFPTTEDTEAERFNAVAT